MTCGKKHCDNAPTEATKVDPTEVEGRPLCDHPGCDKRVVGDGKMCADGHVQGLGAAPGTPAPPSMPLGGYSATYARLEELRWLDDPLGMFIRMRLRRDFEQRLRTACTELHQQLFPRRKRINYENLPLEQVEALGTRISQELSVELEAAQAEHLALRRHLDELAATVELVPGATETCVAQSSRRTYGTQTQERLYAREELSPHVERLEQAGFTARVEETAYGFALWSNAEPWQLDALRRRSAQSPLDWAVACWRRGVNPKVYYPFLDDAIFEQSLELYALEQRQGQK